MCQFSANSIGAGIFNKRSKIIGRFRDRHLNDTPIEVVYSDIKTSILFTNGVI